MFYGFGLAGLAWSVWWEGVVKGIQETEPEAHAKLTNTSRQLAVAAAAARGVAPAAEEPMPWRAFLRNSPVRALAYTHFCNNWCDLSGTLSLATTLMHAIVVSCLVFKPGARQLVHAAVADRVFKRCPCCSLLC